MELGVAGTIETIQISGTHTVHKAVNNWLEDNADVEVLDIKFSTTGDYADALVIYRKE